MKTLNTLQKAIIYAAIILLIIILFVVGVAQIVGNYYIPIIMILLTEVFCSLAIVLYAYIEQKGSKNE